MHLTGYDKSRVFMRAKAGGFTLIEVMVAVVVTAIGLLGIAKIQALAYASTGSANIRSLVAIQAAGLAASMHANRNYWAFVSTPTPLKITGTTISDAALNGNTTSCLGTLCTDAATLAAFDLHTWANALNNMLANSKPVTTINCPLNTPITCTIQVTWNEKAVAINSQAAAQAAADTTDSTFAPTYTLYVEP